MIGERIKLGRKMRGLSMLRLAELSGISVSKISQFERDLKTSNSGELIQLTNALGVTPEFLLRPSTVSLLEYPDEEVSDEY